MMRYRQHKRCPQCGGYGLAVEGPEVSCKECGHLLHVDRGTGGTPVQADARLPQGCSLTAYGECSQDGVVLQARVTFEG